MSTPNRQPTLHEVLAVEKGFSGQSDKCRTQLAATFNSKRHLFEEKAKVFTPTTEGAKQETTIESTIQSTVASELDWLQGFLVKSIDAAVQVAEANTSARADIVLESGETLALNVPATALLALAKDIAEI